MSIGAAAVAPAFHCIAIDGFWTMYYELSLDWILLMAVVYLSGALIYAYRVPERYFPGKCDIWVCFVNTHAHENNIELKVLL